VFERRDVWIDLRKWTDSGVGTYLQNVVPGVLAGLLEADLSIGVVVGEEHQSVSFDGVTRHETNVRPSTLKDQRLLFELSKSATTVWVPFHNAPFVWGSKTRLVSTMYDALFLTELSPLTGFKSQIAKTFLKRMAAKSDFIITISQFSVDELTRYCPKAKDKIRMAWCGTPGVPPLVDRSRVPDYPFVMVVGSPKRHKNYSIALEATEMVAGRAQVFLVAVCSTKNLNSTDGKFIERVKASSAAAQFSDVTNAQLSALFQSAQAVLVPSLYEGFGLPILEAFRQGCPVIASDIAVFREILHGYAYLCPADAPSAWAEKLQAVIDLPASERAELVRDVQTRADRFTWDAAIETTTKTILDASPSLAGHHERAMSFRATVASTISRISRR
jgi:glycosyltransferase involved in cell wall biosynthesis